MAQEEEEEEYSHQLDVFLQVGSSLFFILRRGCITQLFHFCKGNVNKNFLFFFCFSFFQPQIFMIYFYFVVKYVKLQQKFHSVSADPPALSP